jgi:hypothetical protein
VYDIKVTVREFSFLWHETWCINTPGLSEATCRIRWSSWNAVAPPCSRKEPVWAICAPAVLLERVVVVEIQTVIAIVPKILAMAPTIDWHAR